MATKVKAPTLDDHLDKHWNGEDLHTLDELPPDPSTMTASARFAAEVAQAAPRWVMLPVPPANREMAKRNVAALRRRGMESAMRPHPDNHTAWAVWARAKAPESTPVLEG